MPVGFRQVFFMSAFMIFPVWFQQVSSSLNNLFMTPIPNRAYSDGGTMSEIRYANTKILIVTCYLLLQGQKRCCAFAMPSFCLRYAFASGSLPFDGASTDLQRTNNGFTTDLQWNCIGGITRAFFASLHRFSSILNKVNLPEINAYCCVIETISRLYLIPNFYIIASLSLFQMVATSGRNHDQ